MAGGIPVPGDPEQVIYVWWDALANYITALGYGTESSTYRHWWIDNPNRVHVIGKGILRFHAVYWSAMLLSAGQPLPTVIYVHEYLTAGGQKISKSAGNTEDPHDLADRYGTDALRWWFLRDVTRIGDTDFTADRLVNRANEDLANDIGNLINRTVTMIHRFLGGRTPRILVRDRRAEAMTSARDAAPAAIDGALDRFDFRSATNFIVELADQGNRYIMVAKPWELANAVDRGDEPAELLESVLGELIVTCRALGKHLEPFLPDAAARIAQQCGGDGEEVPEPVPTFPRIETGAVKAPI